MPAQKELALGLIVLLSGIGTEFTCNFSMTSILLPIVNSLVSSFLFTLLIQSFLLLELLMFEINQYVNRLHLK